MNIWHLTKKDLRVFFKDRGAWLWLFVLPLVFLLIFSGLSGLSQTGGSAEGSSDQRPTLVVVNLDEGGSIAQSFLEDLDRRGGYRLVFFEHSEAIERLNLYKIGRYLLIPAGFSSELSQGKPTSLELIVHPNASLQTSEYILKAVEGVARDTSLELQILDGIRQMGEMQASDASGDQIFNTERILGQAKSQFERSRETPLIAVIQEVPRAEEETSLSVLNLSTTIVPGMAVLFVFLAAQTAAKGIFEERRAGSLRRLLAAPLRRWEVLAGKMLPILILITIQIGFIFAAGALILPVLGLGRLGAGSNVLAWLIASLVIALCSACLGILIASIAKSEGQITGLSNAILWIAGFLGGAIIPAFFLQSIPMLNILSRFVPHYWATSAYYDILARGKGLVEVMPSLAVLLIFSAGFFILGVRRFRFE